MYATLQNIIPNLDKLPEEALNSLFEAERRIEDKNSPDFAPCVVAYAKAVEITLKDLVFEEFRKFSRNKSIDIEYSVKVVMTDWFKKASNFVFYIQKGKHLELGSMSFALRLTTGSTAKHIELLSQFKEFVTFQLNLPKLFDKEKITLLENLAKDYRNPAAHAHSFNQDEAKEVREISIELLNVLC